LNPTPKILVAEEGVPVLQQVRGFGAGSCWCVGSTALLASRQPAKSEQRGEQAPAAAGQIKRGKKAGHGGLRGLNSYRHQAGLKQTRPEKSGPCPTDYEVFWSDARMAASWWRRVQSGTKTMPKAPTEVSLSLTVV
jgi:hypothetical protein